MKVLLLNGSPHVSGCTARALEEMIKVFTEEGVAEKKWEIPTRKEEQGKYILSDVAASVKEAVTECGHTMEDVIGIGIGVGENRAREAAEQAISISKTSFIAIAVATAAPLSPNGKTAVKRASKIIFVKPAAKVEISPN